ncbi:MULTISPECIES: APC family permease [unclassified Rathayibacter]|uniref:APC family permease n=1 Tax=unclassified Rathayibacter TaxID=2609250 RepID=UPI000CE72AEC|nr:MULTISPECIES: amino acid permease [unclassified Rathayibacter]PPF17112.1 amino acid permease [Rathayibacter sp. AY1A4]PPG76600.1 amino acid permease [Rathayibacter sp. AY1E5]PPH27645.1 amino acid permease [Rathayibacter sp. AY1C3]PPH60456.1 amino acid permease [Rathayibacter sp. AY1D7]PPI27613.1 amino acid permease [Rathayibacter sp. AY1B4]
MSTTEDVDDGTAEFGYRPSLTRGIGRFGSFAAGVSYISILTGTFQLFSFGFALGGPAYWWSWPIVFAGQLMVALCFAELAARYPVAGSVYNWSKRLAGPTVSWLAGWLMATASVVTLAAVVLAYQATLPQIWSGFQLGGSAGVSAVVWGALLIAFTTAVNARGVRLMARINSVGVLIELVAAVLLVAVLAVNVVHPPTVLLDTSDYGGSTPGGYAGAFLIAAIASAYVMYGFDTAGSLGEETVDPRRTAPTAILRAVTASFVLGGLILLLGILSAPDLADPALGQASGGLQRIVLQVLGAPLGTVLLLCVVVAITVCALAVHTAAIRLIFAMARDNALPGSRVLARVDPRRGTPVAPALVVGVLAVLILVVNIGTPAIFTAVTSVAVILIYLAYLLVTVPLLIARLRGRWPAAAPGRFSLGRGGLPVNVVAVLWGAAMTVDLAWPRVEVYGEELRWSAVVVIAAVVGIGLAWFLLRGRHRLGTLPAHALPSTPPQG